MTDEPDIKALLARALGEQEPPLRIDRDEIFRAGRHRVRRRRAFEAGGVVAAVVVAAVGASLLTGLVGGPEENQLPPAASTTDVAPPGLDLPLTSTPQVPTSAQNMPTSETPLPPNGTSTFNSDHANALTEAVYNSPATKGVDLLALAGQSGKPAFVTQISSYVFEADVVDSGMEGSLRITVEAEPNRVPVNCGDMPQPGDCAVNDDHEVAVAVSTWTDGEVSRRVVRAVLPDGSKVTAESTNQSSRLHDAGKPPMNQKPPLSEYDLVKLVLKAGLRVA